jgi:hypothetical protein
MGLMVSCSTNHTISQLMELSKIDFDKFTDSKQYVSLNFDEAWEWMKKENENGYIVRMNFNKETGEHICKSIPKGKISLPTEEELLPLLDENGEFLLEDEAKE